MMSIYKPLQSLLLGSYHLFVKCIKFAPNCSFYQELSKAVDWGVGWDLLIGG